MAPSVPTHTLVQFEEGGKTAVIPFSTIKEIYRYEDDVYHASFTPEEINVVGDIEDHTWAKVLHVPYGRHRRWVVLIHGLGTKDEMDAEQQRIQDEKKRPKRPCSAASDVTVSSINSSRRPMSKLEGVNFGATTRAVAPKQSKASYLTGKKRQHTRPASAASDVTVSSICSRRSLSNLEGPASEATATARALAANQSATSTTRDKDSPMTNATDLKELLQQNKQIIEQNAIIINQNKEIISFEKRLKLLEQGISTFTKSQSKFREKQEETKIAVEIATSLSRKCVELTTSTNDVVKHRNKLAATRSAIAPSMGSRPAVTFQPGSSATLPDARSIVRPASARVEPEVPRLAIEAPPTAASVARPLIAPSDLSTHPETVEQPQSSAAMEQAEQNPHIGQLSSSTNILPDSQPLPTPYTRPEISMSDLTKGMSERRGYIARGVIAALEAKTPQKEVVICEDPFVAVPFKQFKRICKEHGKKAHAFALNLFVACFERAGRTVSNYSMTGSHDSQRLANDPLFEAVIAFVKQLTFFPLYTTKGKTKSFTDKCNRHKKEKAVYSDSDENLDANVCD